MYKQIINPITGLVRENCILRIADMAYIPFAEGNVDYEKYLKWVEEGNTPEPADE